MIIFTSFLGAYMTVRAVSIIYGGWPKEAEIAEYI